MTGEGDRSAPAASRSRYSWTGAGRRQTTRTGMGLIRFKRSGSSPEDWRRERRPGRSVQTINHCERADGYPCRRL